MRVMNFIRRRKQQLAPAAICTLGVAMITWAVTRENMVFYQDTIFLLDMVRTGAATTLFGAGGWWQRPIRTKAN